MNIHYQKLYDDLKIMSEIYGIGSILEILRDICTDNALVCRADYGDDIRGGQFENLSALIAKAVTKEKIYMINQDRLINLLQFVAHIPKDKDLFHEIRRGMDFFGMTEIGILQTVKKYLEKFRGDENCEIPMHCIDMLILLAEVS